MVPQLQGHEQELESALMSIFGQAQIDNRGKDIIYSSEGSPVLRLRYKRHRLEGVAELEGLSIDDADRVYDMIKSVILEPHKSIVLRYFLFTTRPVKSYWRPNNRFQLGPVPKGAPRANVLGARHPAVIEFPVAECGDLMADQIRFFYLYTELGLLVSLIVDGGLTLSNKSHSAEWVVDLDAERTICGQIGYEFSEFPFKAESFRKIPNEKHMKVTNRELYFKRFGISISDPWMDIFDGSERIVESYFSLAGEDRLKFFQAMKWLNHSIETSKIAGGLSYLCAASSIECLIQQSNGNKGVKATFIEFLEKYAPGMDSKIYGEIYRRRSDLSHGNTMFLHDIRADALNSNPLAISDYLSVFEVYSCARVALINWLLSRAL